MVFRLQQQKWLLQLLLLLWLVACSQAAAQPRIRERRPGQEYGDVLSLMLNVTQSTLDTTARLSGAVFGLAGQYIYETGPTIRQLASSTVESTADGARSVMSGMRDMMGFSVQPASLVYSSSDTGEKHDDIELPLFINPAPNILQDSKPSTTTARPKKARPPSPAIFSPNQYPTTREPSSPSPSRRRTSSTLRFSHSRPVYSSTRRTSSRPRSSSRRRTSSRSYSSRRRTSPSRYRSSNSRRVSSQNYRRSSSPFSIFSIQRMPVFRHIFSA